MGGGVSLIFPSSGKEFTLIEISDRVSYVCVVADVADILLIG